MADCQAVPAALLIFLSALAGHTVVFWLSLASAKSCSFSSFVLALTLLDKKLLARFYMWPCSKLETSWAPAWRPAFILDINPEARPECVLSPPTGPNSGHGENLAKALWTFGRSLSGNRNHSTQEFFYLRQTSGHVFKLMHHVRSSLEEAQLTSGWLRSKETGTWGHISKPLCMTESQNCM